jgi:hypothetical protein
MNRSLYTALCLALLAPHFAQAEPFSREQRRQQIREWVISNAEGRSDSSALPTIAPGENDQAAALVDTLKFTNLAQIEAAGLMKAQLPASPWSDSYWPTYAGQLANRYNDPDFNSNLIWRDNAAFLTKAIGRGKPETFSPAEKYDLLLGDTGFTLTRKMINAGAPYADEQGEVERWFGLCHGWAPAAFMLDRPAKAVTVKAAGGREVEFTPTDIKALATLLWAGAGARTRFVGGRCNDKDPSRGDNDRETNPDCFDTNPMTWHLVAVNQIGVGQRSFVMDASAGYEVWNQPVYGYQYGYINPITGKSARSLAEGKVKLAEYVNDPYKKTRSRQAEYVVKIVMTVDYVSETMPSAEKTDGPDRDNHSIVNYSYDLELDRDDNIVGGEWYSSVHPDFLWVPAPGAKARSVGDAALDRNSDSATWRTGEAIPASWKNAGRMSAQREQPLARIVERLVELAK